MEKIKTEEVVISNVRETTPDTFLKISSKELKVTQKRKKLAIIKKNGKKKRRAKESTIIKGRPRTSQNIFLLQ